MSKVFSYDEAMEATVAYFNGDEAAAHVFIGKYALRNNDGELVEKTPADMHVRLATKFAEAEAKYADGMSYDEIYSLFDGFKYVIPQGSPMSAIGNEYSIQSASKLLS